MKISCILPSMNRRTLHEICLPSALNQSSEFHEIFVVFDLPESDLKYNLPKGVKTIFTGGRSGGPAARKLAYSRISGDFVVLLDDDDSLALDFVEKLINFLNQQEVLPSLALPRIRKVWPEGLIPSMWARPYVSGDDMKSDVSLYGQLCMLSCYFTSKSL